MVAYSQLPVSALPQVDYPTIQVVAFYPGASPEVMASSVTTPLERQFGQLPGLKQMTSTSSFGASLVTLQFVLEHQIDGAGRRCRSARTRGHSCPRRTETVDLQQGHRRHADICGETSSATLSASGPRRTNLARNLAAPGGWCRAGGPSERPASAGDPPRGRLRLSGRPARRARRQTSTGKGKSRGGSRSHGANASSAGRRVSTIVVATATARPCLSDVAKVVGRVENGKEGGLGDDSGRDSEITSAGRQPRRVDPKP